MRKGAILGLDMFNPVASIVVFQFNPEKLTRTLAPQTAGKKGSIFETERLKGPPDETIELELKYDASDELAEGEAIADSLGLYTQLSALEMLVYPKFGPVLANTALLAQGAIEIVPPTGPLTLFVWGPQRILPVKIKEFTITEEKFDSNLNPIEAKAKLKLDVLSYNDLSLTHPGYWIFMAHNILKEAFASIGSGANLTTLDDLFE